MAVTARLPEIRLLKAVLHGHAHRKKYCKQYRSQRNRRHRDHISDFRRLEACYAETADDFSVGNIHAVLLSSPFSCTENARILGILWCET